MVERYGAVYGHVHINGSGNVVASSTFLRASLRGATPHPHRPNNGQPAIQPASPPEYGLYIHANVFGSLRSTRIEFGQETDPILCLIAAVGGGWVSG